MENLIFFKHLSNGISYRFIEMYPGIYLFSSKLYSINQLLFLIISRIRRILQYFLQTIMVSNPPICFCYFYTEGRYHLWNLDFENIWFLSCLVHWITNAILDKCEMISWDSNTSSQNRLHKAYHLGGKRYISSLHFLLILYRTFLV